MSGLTLFVVNPISGDNDKSSITNRIKSWSQSSGESIEIWETSGKNDKENLEQKIKEITPAKVVAVGGDGTILLCASILMNSKVPLGILPMGSANGMSAELHIPQNIKDALDVVHRGYSRKSDMLLFNDKDLGMHISDIGLNAGLVKQFEEGPRRGFLGYAKGIVGELSDLNPFKIKIETDIGNYESKGYMVAFGNAKRYGTGALLNNVGKINDGLLELSILNYFDITAIAGHFFDIINDESEHMKTIQCKKATIYTDRKVPFQIDGELQPDTNKVKVEVLPECISFVVPKSRVL
ncbi:diacylglycerol/lipid kinase family protein [Owenweeksia hongkongensis]|uniref:diacylglycerol/lipid kinase family protein n=1 Tax=Owenweeksia hongkongensis TaxID=253245 RepID=UPI003A908E3F